MTVQYITLTTIKQEVSLMNLLQSLEKPVAHSDLSQKFYTIGPVFLLDVEVDTHSILLLNIRKDQNKSTRRDYDEKDQKII